MRGPQNQPNFFESMIEQNFRAELANVIASSRQPSKAPVFCSRQDSMTVAISTIRMRPATNAPTASSLAAFVDQRARRTDGNNGNALVFCEIK